jgi:hypothetical protein
MRRFKVVAQGRSVGSLSQQYLNTFHIASLISGGCGGSSPMISWKMTLPSSRKFSNGSFPVYIYREVQKSSCILQTRILTSSIVMPKAQISDAFVEEVSSPLRISGAIQRVVPHRPVVYPETASILDTPKSARHARWLSSTKMFACAHGQFNAEDHDREYRTALMSPWMTAFGLRVCKYSNPVAMSMI